LWDVVNPRAINEFLIVIKKEALTFKQIVMPIVAYDELMCFGQVQDAEILS